MPSPTSESQPISRKREEDGNQAIFLKCAEEGTENHEEKRRKSPQQNLTADLFHDPRDDQDMSRSFQEGKTRRLWQE
jgi:hypothetical protein